MTDIRDLIKIVDGVKPVINESAGVPMNNIPVKFINSGWGDNQGKVQQVNGVLTADAHGAPMLKIEAQGGTMFASFNNGEWVCDMD